MPRSQLLQLLASPRWLTPSLLHVPTKSPRRCSVAIHESIDLALACKGLLLIEYGDASSTNVLLLRREKRSWRLLQSLQLQGETSPGQLVATFDQQNQYRLIKALQGRLPLRFVARGVTLMMTQGEDGSRLPTMSFGKSRYDYSLVSRENAHSLPPSSFVVVAPKPGLLELLLASCGLRPHEPVVTAASMGTLPATQSLDPVMVALKERYLGEIGALYRGDGPESVHQARASLRRFALIVRLRSSRPDVKRVSQIFHALGDIRNLDIVTGWMAENAVDQSRIDQALALRSAKFNAFCEKYPLRTHRRFLAIARADQFEPDLTLDSWALHSRAKLADALVAIDLADPSFATIHRFRRQLRRYSDFAQIFPMYRFSGVDTKQTLSKLGQLSDLSTIRAYMQNDWPEVAEVDRRRDRAKSDVLPELVRLRSQISIRSADMHRFRAPQT